MNVTSLDPVASARSTSAQGRSTARIVALLASTSAAVLAMFAGAPRAEDWTIDGGNYATIDDGTQTVDGTLTVGGYDFGGLYISYGGSLNVTGGLHHYIGKDAGSIGFVSLDGAGSRLSMSGFLYVGGFGTGTVDITGGSAQISSILVGNRNGSEGQLGISGGGSLSTTGAWIGAEAGSEGSATVTGAGTAWTSTGGNFHVGQSGTGALSIADGGKVTAPAVSIASNPGSYGTVLLSGSPGGRGTLETRSVSKGSGQGTLTFDGGILRARSDSLGQLLTGFGAGEVVIDGGGAFVDTNGRTVEIATPLQGSGGLTKTGSGTLTLSGANAYQGGTTVNAGTLIVGGTNALGTGPVTNDATLTFSNAAWNFNPNISGSGILRKEGAGALTLNGTNTYTGGTVINSGAEIHTHARGIGTGAVTNNGHLRVGEDVSDFFRAGPMVGTGSFGKNGAGRLYLDRVNTYSGVTYIWEGTLALVGSGTVGTGRVEIGGGAAFDIIGADGDRTVNGISGYGTVRLGANRLALNIDGFAAFDGSFQGEGGIVKRGTGSLALNGSNTHSGGTVIEQGGIATSAAGLGTGNVVNNGHLTFNQSVDGAFQGSISGSGQVTKRLGSTLTLDGSSSIAGALSVEGGTLALRGNGAIGPARVAVSSGANLDISDADGNRSIGGLTGAGTLLLGANRLTVDTSSDDTFEGAIQGTGGLTKHGDGTLTLRGGNTSTGGTTISQGTLVAINSASLGSGTVTNDATLVMQAPTLSTGWVFSPRITGAGRLIKQGQGYVTLTGDNDYTGGTNVERGGIHANARSVGTGGITLANGTYLRVEEKGSDTLAAGPISGSGYLVKAGSGTLTLDKINSYGGVTNVLDGTLALSGAGTTGAGLLYVGTGSTFDISAAHGDRAISGINGNGNVTLGANTLLVDGSDASSFGGIIAGQGGLTKRGTGTLTLTGISTHSGDTEVEAGSLVLNGGLSGGGNVNVRSGAVLSGIGSIAGVVNVGEGGTLSGGAGNAVAMGGLQLGAGSILSVLTLPYSGSSDAVFDVGGDLRLDGELRLAMGTLDYGTYGLIGYGGTLIDNGILLGPTPAAWDRSQFNVTTDGGVVRLVVGTSSDEQVWRGGDGTWSNGSDWTDANGSLKKEWSGKAAVFGGTSGTVQVEGWQSFSSIKFMSDGYSLVEGNSGELEIAGREGGVFVNGGATASMLLPITGNGRLAKSGGGTLVLGDDNTYSGGTRIEMGTLIGSASSFGAGDIENDGVLRVQQTSDGILSATISGSGLLHKTGSATLELTGTNTYSGGTRIETGGLLVSSDGNLGAATGGIEFVNTSSLIFGSSFDLSADRPIVLTAGSAVFDTNGFDTTVRSSISGGGSFVKVGGGTMTLLGRNSHRETNVFQGALVVSAGSLAGSVRNAVGSGAELVFDQGSDASFAHAIDGGGDLIKRGAGRLNLTGVSGLTGATFVREGNLAVNGSLASAVNVGADAVLSGAGTVGGLAVADRGIVAPGNSIGTLNVAGNVAFGPGSFYEVEVDPAGTADRIAATGKATLSGGTVRVLAEDGSYRPATSYRILTAENGVDGRFANVTSNFAFLTPSLAYDPNQVVLTLIRKTADDDGGGDDTGGGDKPGTPEPLPFSRVAVTKNQASTAKAVEALGNGHRVFDAVVGQSVAGARQAFDALSGEVHASAAGTALHGTLRTQDMLLGRMRSLQAPVGGQVHAAYAVDRSGVVPSADMLAGPSFDPRRLALWGEGFGSWGRVGPNGNAAGMDTATGGFALGAEARLDKTFTLGMAGGFSRTTFDVDGRLSSGAAETVFGAVYGAAQWDALNLRLGVLYGHHDIDTQRTITFPGFREQASASYHGSTAMAFGEVGYGFELGRVTIEPFVGASLMRLRLDGFREDGGAAALVGSGRSYDLGTTTLGVRTAAAIGAELPLTLRGMVGWRHAFGAIEPAALLAFSGGSTGFSVAGLPIDHNAVVAEAGLDWRINKDMTLGVSYSGQIGARAQEHAVTGNFTWRFETR